MGTPSSASRSTTTSLNPSGAMANGMAMKTARGSTWSFPASRHSAQPRWCWAMRATIEVSKPVGGIGASATIAASSSWVG